MKNTGNKEREKVRFIYGLIKNYYLVLQLYNCKKKMQFWHFTSPVANIFLCLDCTFPLHFPFASSAVNTHIVGKLFKTPGKVRIYGSSQL